ncbi:MAG TPA: transglycosylase domain-containing protein, partial [bacterium]|nr:transglycosylase domain-containing protein [bacterium]
MTSLLRFAWWVIMVATAFFAGVVYESFSEEVGSFPSRSQLGPMLTLNQVRFERDAEGGLRAVCFCGSPVSTSDIPDPVKQALVAFEDRRFYLHPGVDPLGIARAITKNFEAGRFEEGGSTLTQQLVKNVLLSPKRTLGRKGLEAILALYVEYHFTKKEILTAYLHRVEFGRIAGRPVVGIEQASLIFFRKHVWQLGLYESALLIGVLKAPSRWDLFDHPKAARDRAKIVLSAMVRRQFITQRQATSAIARGIRHRNSKRIWIETRYFTRWVEQELTSAVPDLQPALGLRLFVTLDAETQSYAELAVARAVGGRNTEAALVSMSFDGAVRALVGGRSYGRSQFDRATQALRQPASAFKPFVYLAALERGYTPNSKILDAPFGGGKWTPRNFGGKYYGLITLQDALARSANTATVRLCDAVGPARVTEVARRLGISSRLRIDRSIALGTSEVTLMELTAAYGAFANGGYLVSPYGIVGISNDEGKVLYWRNPKPAWQVIAAGQVVSIHRMLRHVVARGTGTPANIGSFAAGKTGTGQGFRDAWFIGYSDRLVTGLWEGND